MAADFTGLCLLPLVGLRQVAEPWSSPCPILPHLCPSSWNLPSPASHLSFPGGCRASRYHFCLSQPGGGAALRPCHSGHQARGLRRWAARPCTSPSSQMCSVAFHAWASRPSEGVYIFLLYIEMFRKPYEGGAPGLGQPVPNASPEFPALP